MRPHYILAHDLGTTGNKATLFDADNNTTVAAAFESYQTAYPQPGWAEQDPGDWQRAIWQCTHRLLIQSGIDAHAIAAVSFSGHMHGALLVDHQGTPLGQAIIWADQRATAQADFMRSTCGSDFIYHLTGHRASAAYTAPKVLWLKDHQPDLYARACRILQPKDYAAFLLTGVFATDHSDASGTLVFDLVRRQWSNDVMAALGLNPNLFPDAFPSTTVIGHVTPSAAQATGLVAGTPVVIGGGDGACATVGSGSVHPGDAYTYIGSSAWIALTTAQPIYDLQQRTFTFASLMPDLYFSLGTMQSAGGAYDWLERLLFTETGPQTIQAMDALAADVPAGAGGLVFLPYLLGERSPHWNPLARASFVGLAMPHGRAQVTRAVLEGVALNLRWILDILQTQGVQVDKMRLIGGGAQSAVWRQILADVFKLPIVLPALTAEATALGAVVAGGVGVGLFQNFDVVDQLIAVREAERPESARSQFYDKRLGIFERTYKALEPIYDELAELPKTATKDSQ